MNPRLYGLAVGLVFSGFGCGPNVSADSDWIVRIDDGELSANCSIEDWGDSDDSLPDPWVEVTDNLSGESWKSTKLEDTLSPEWNQAVWNGGTRSTQDLSEYGFLVELFDEDRWDEQTGGQESVSVSESDFLMEYVTAEMDCGSLTFSLIRD